MQQSARYYPLRQSALKNLRRWQAELSEQEVSQRLAAGLHDPHPRVRRKAMLVAGWMEHRSAIPILLTVLRGGTPDTVALAELPDAELEDVPSGFDDVGGSSSDAEIAALALGLMKHEDAATQISELETTPMTEIALALLGETEQLRQEHFALNERNQAAQLAAVEAVIRCRGRHGLAWAMGYRTASHGWEKDRVADSLRMMLDREGTPGRELLKPGPLGLKDLEAWYLQHGSAYLQEWEAAPGPP